MARINIPKRQRGATGGGHSAWREQEAHTAERVGGRVTPGSGAGNEKGDIRVPGLVRIECKSTAKKSFPLSPELVEKLENATAATGERACVFIQFVDELGNKRGPGLVILPESALDLISR